MLMVVANPTTSTTGRPSGLGGGALPPLYEFTNARDPDGNTFAIEERMTP
jgi:hypothetical protein